MAALPMNDPAALQSLLEEEEEGATELDDVNASVSVGLEGDVGFRSELADAGAVEETIDRISAPSERGRRDQRGGHQARACVAGVEALHAPQGSFGLTLGVEDEVLMVARTPAQALATATPSAVPEATGSVTLLADAATIAERTVSPSHRGGPREPAGVRGTVRRADRLARGRHGGLRGHWLLTVE